MIENATWSAAGLVSRGTIVVSQIPVDKWHQVIGHPTLADAICDRIVHSAHRIELKGRREDGQEEEPE